MISEEVRNTVNDVLAAQIGALGYDRAEIFESEDHDGDPILKIDIHYRKMVGKLDLTPTVSLTRYLREALQQKGEPRFPHLQHRFAEDQQFKAA